MPIRLVGADEDVAAASIREVDMQRKYRWTKPQLAEKLGLSQPRSLALRRHLGIEDDPSCVHDFTFGKLVHRQYSDNAYRRMKDALDSGVDMDDVWRRCRPRASPAAVPQAESA